MWGALLAQQTPARVEAQEPLGTVVIVRVPKDAPVAARIRAELEANDWRVRELGPDSGSARAPLPSLATSHRARAALRMNPARSAVELWVASDGGAGGGGEVVRVPGGERDAALLALRATEALRARGLKLPRQAGPEPPVTPAAPDKPSASGMPASEATPEQTAAAEERARKQAEEAAREAREQKTREQAERDAAAQAERERLERERLERQAEERAAREAEARAEADEAAEEAEDEDEAAEEAEDAAEAGTPVGRLRPALLFVEAGPAMAASQRGAGPSWAGWLNLRVQPAAAWSLSGFGFLPFAGGSVGSELGSGWIRSFMVGGTLDLHGAFGRLDLSAGAGAAMLITLTRATSNHPRYDSQTDDTDFTTAALARIALHVAVTRRVRVGARVMFGLAIPELRVEFEDAEVATWGRPFVVAALVVDIGLPVAR